MMTSSLLHCSLEVCAVIWRDICKITSIRSPQHFMICRRYVVTMEHAGIPVCGRSVYRRERVRGSGPAARWLSRKSYELPNPAQPISMSCPSYLQSRTHQTQSPSPRSIYPPALPTLAAAAKVSLLHPKCLFMRRPIP